MRRRNSLALFLVSLSLSLQGFSAPEKWSSSVLKQTSNWYASHEAKSLADTLLKYQSEYGAWPKNVDFLQPASSTEIDKIKRGSKANTIDNGATTLPMRYLARVYQGTADESYRDAFLHGLSYLLESQYQNGGFPQFYPLRGDKYYSRITFNDNAMVNVLELLRDIDNAKTPYDFIDEPLRQSVADSLARGIDCILKTQIIQNGSRTAWCAQHDEHTLAPAWARAYEPPSLSGGETVGIIKFLMGIEHPPPEIVASIDGAVTWLKKVAIRGKRLDKVRNADGRTDRHLVDDPSAPLLRARFYELETNHPLYLDRDSVFHYNFDEIGYERRSGYGYHGDWGATLLQRDYPRWKTKYASAQSIQTKRRVVVSTDVGGTDFDDFQSLVHLFVYSDSIDIEGILSSPSGLGRKENILQVIDHYEHDYPNLKTYSSDYPTPGYLRSISKQGETEIAPYAGYRHPTEGSEWIIRCARLDDPRPLHILVWGGIEDLAQALHDAPDILPKLRVYFIGGPNKKWSPDAYQYIASHHQNLFIIEANSTYRGWFVGGDQTGNLANDRFAPTSVAGRGALGDFFASGITFEGETRSVLKMGDSPSLAWTIDSPNTDDPSLPNWGGQFTRAWKRPYSLFNRLTSEQDTIEAFSILELALPIPVQTSANPTAEMQIENQRLPAYAAPDGTLRIRFCPKAAKTFSYTIHSNLPSLDGKTGKITALNPSPDAAAHPSDEYANWWTDNPDPSLAIDDHQGAATISQWRKAFLEDFAIRMLRCVSPAPEPQ